MTRATGCRAWCIRSSGAGRRLISGANGLDRRCSRRPWSMRCYLLLVKQDRTAWQNRAQFFGVASQMMRRILVDRARARNMAKRSGRWARVTLDEEIAQGQAGAVDVLDLDRALRELTTFDARKSQIAELRFFGGLSLDETGQVLGISVATVEREWQAARAWLYARLTPASP